MKKNINPAQEQKKHNLKIVRSQKTAKSCKPVNVNNKSRDIACNVSTTTIKKVEVQPEREG